jgi:hypothetical protein
MHTVIVTLSLPSRSPHDCGHPLLTAFSIGSKLTGSKQPLEVSSLFPLYPVMENQYASSKDGALDNSSSPEQGLLTRLITVDEIVASLACFTDEQRSLAWSPEPPFESTGAHDCRVGGSCGLDFNRETARARWIQARHRWNSEQKKLPDTSSPRG